jgi:hypothetical protein
MKYDQKASSALIKVLRKCGEQQIDVHIIYRLPIHPFVREHALYISFAGLPSSDAAFINLLSRLLNETKTSQ